MSGLEAIAVVGVVIAISFSAHVLRKEAKERKKEAAQRSAATTRSAQIVEPLPAYSKDEADDMGLPAYNDIEHASRKSHVVDNIQDRSGYRRGWSLRRLKTRIRNRAIGQAAHGSKIFS